MLLPHRCPGCRRPAHRLCPTCAGALRPPPPEAPVPALFAYDGVGRRVITGLKYANQRGVVPLLAAALVTLVPAGVTTVTWAPTTKARRVRRGFDQAEALAHALAGALGVPCRPLLTRVNHRPQTGRSRSARCADAPLFRAIGRPPPGLTVVVDDVVTTGATLQRAVEALLAAGCPAVAPVAVAATPSPRHRR